MSTLMRPALPLLLPLLLLLATPQPSSASGKKANLTSLLFEERSALKLLDQHNQRVSRSEEQLASLRYRSEQLGYQQKEAKRRIAALRERSRQRGANVRQRLRALYKLSRGGLVRLLVAASDSGELTRNAQLLSRVVSRDIEELRLYRAELVKLRTEQRQLARREQQQKRNAARIAQQHQALERARRQQQALLRKIRGSRAARVKVAGELSELQRRLLRRISYLRYRMQHSGRFVERKGRLRRPVRKAMIAARFGKVRDRSTGIELARSGLTFRVAPRSAARAVATGRVQLAQQVPGYGKVVVIHHDDGYYTLTGFLRRLKIKAGDKVTEGRVIGVAGNDPLDGQPAVYFEIRHGQRAVDPIAWLKR